MNQTNYINQKKIFINKHILLINMLAIIAHSLNVIVHAIHIKTYSIFKIEKVIKTKMKKIIVMKKYKMK